MVLELSAVVVTSVLLSSCGGEGLPEPTARPSVTETRPTVEVPTDSRTAELPTPSRTSEPPGPSRTLRAPRSHERAESNTRPIIAGVAESDPNDNSDGHSISRLPDTADNHVAQFHGVSVD